MCVYNQEGVICILSLLTYLPLSVGTGVYLPDWEGGGRLQTGEVDGLCKQR